MVSILSNPWILLLALLAILGIIIFFAVRKGRTTSAPADEVTPFEVVEVTSANAPDPPIAEKPTFWTTLLHMFRDALERRQHRLEIREQAKISLLLRKEETVAEKQRLQNEAKLKELENRQILQQQKLQQKADMETAKKQQVVAKKLLREKVKQEKQDQKAAEADRKRVAKEAKSAARKLRWAPRKQFLGKALRQFIQAVLVGLLFVVAIPVVIIYIAILIMIALVKALWDYAIVNNNNRAKICIAISIILAVWMVWVFMGELFPSSDVPLADKIIADFMEPNVHAEPSTSLWLLLGLPILWIGWTIFTVIYSIFALREEGAEFGSTVIAKVVEVTTNLSAKGISGLASVFKKGEATSSGTYVMAVASPPVLVPLALTSGTAVPTTAAKSEVAKFFSSFERILPFGLLLQELWETIRHHKRVKE